MGDSKRRKQFDPNYGKKLPLTPKLTNYCNSVLAKESALIVLDFWADAGGVAIAAQDIKGLSHNQLAAYNIACQPSFINLGIRRQHEQSRGCMSLMTRHYRQEILHVGTAEFGHIIFNWMSDREVEIAHKECSKRKQGRTVVHEVVDYLINNCDPNYQFPCWFSGIPSQSNADLFLDLIFICDKRHPSQEQIDTLNYETFS